MKGLTFFSPSFTDSVIDVLDKNFNQDFSLLTSSNERRCGSPNADIREDEKSYIMDLDLPGYTENDVKINLNGKTLTIASSLDEKKEDVKSNYIIRERILRKFSRSFTLPSDIDEDSISAKFENGVLTIDIPRLPEKQPKQIEIQKN